MIGHFLPTTPQGETEDYEIRQAVESVKSVMFPVVYSGKSERVAWAEYHRLAHNHPNESFELVKVVRTYREECLSCEKISDTTLPYGQISEKGATNEKF